MSLLLIVIAMVAVAALIIIATEETTEAQTWRHELKGSRRKLYSLRLRRTESYWDDRNK